MAKVILEKQEGFFVLYTLASMVRDRGYPPKEEEKEVLKIGGKTGLTQGEEDIINEFPGIKNKNRLYKDENGRALLVYFMFRQRGANTIGKVDVLLYRQTLRDYAGSRKKVLDEVIVTVDGNFSTDGWSLFSELTSEASSQTVFSIHELSYCPTEHFFHSPHYRLSPEEKEKFLKTTSGTMDVRILPVIYDTDRIVRHYGWMPGDIIRIRRDESFLGETVDIDVYYRRVVKLNIKRRARTKEGKEAK